MAWQILDRRFNNQRKRLENTMNMLKDEEFITHQDDCDLFNAFACLTHLDFTIPTAKWFYHG